MKINYPLGAHQACGVGFGRCVVLINFIVIILVIITTARWIWRNPAVYVYNSTDRSPALYLHHACCRVVGI